MANKTLQLKIGNTTYRSSVDNTLTNEDLNNVTLPGLYNAGGSNSVTNKPSGIDHFGLLVIHRASGSYYIQIIYNDSKSYRRFCVNGTWGNWTEDKLTDTTYTSLKNPCALTLKINSGGGTAYDGSSPITYDITKTALGMNKVDNTADVDKSVKHAKTADTATTATTVGSATIGGDSCGVYWHNGKPVKMNATVGDARTPIYFLNGTATACSLTKASVGLSVVDNTMDAKKDVATAGAVRSGGTVTAKTGTTLYDSGLRFHAGYNNGYPVSYGNAITLTASGSGELFCGWSGDENSSTHKTSAARLYYRNKRDTSTAVWSDWSTIAFTSDIPTSFAWGSISGKPSTFPPSSHTHTKSQITDFPSSIAYAGAFTGFTRTDAATWGNQTGTVVMGLHSPSGGDIVFRDKNPTDGQLSICIDGCVYQGEGKNKCIDVSGGTFTGQVNFGSGSYYVKSDGSANFRTVTGAVYNDYAEFFPRGEATEPGDIVALDLSSDHESYIKATATSKIVAGVHSDEYAMLIGGDKVDDGNYVEKNIEKYIPVSLCGRVFCKCIGKIHRGDTIIVSEISGVGRAKLPNDYVENTQIVGYAVDEDLTEEIRRVRIRVKG